MSSDLRLELLLAHSATKALQASLNFATHSALPSSMWSDIPPMPAIQNQSTTLGSETPISARLSVDFLALTTSQSYLNFDLTHLFLQDLEIQTDPLNLSYSRIFWLLDPLSKTISVLTSALILQFFA